MVHYSKEYYSKAYDYIKDDEDYEIRAKIAFEKYFSDINNLKTKKIIEVGAGLGKNIYFLPNADAQDISKFSEIFCKSKGINFCYTIKPNYYDIIASIHSLEHIKEPYETLSEIYSKLKKGGIFILVLPYELHKPINHFKIDNNNHLYSWNFRTIDNLLLNVGFKIIKNEYIYEGFGYRKLKLFYRKNPLFLYRLTQVFTKIFFRTHRELKIIAKKV